MRPRIWTWVWMPAIAILAFSATTSAQAPAQPTGEMKMDHAGGAKAPAVNPLTITYGGKSEVWTVASLALAKFDRTAVDVFNSHEKTQQHYSGVAVATLLAHIGVPITPHGKDFRLYLVAEGADGYQVVYSLGEVAPDVHDGTVIVADTLGVDELTGNGPFQLVATGEKRTARWVRNLVSIRVLTAQ